MKNYFVHAFYWGKNGWARETAYITDNHDGTWHINYKITGEARPMDADFTAECAQAAIDDIRSRYEKTSAPGEARFELTEITEENLEHFEAELRKGYDSCAMFIENSAQQEEAEKRNIDILTQIARLEIAVKLVA